jgi:ribose transport system substrate-binding protein
MSTHTSRLRFTALASAVFALAGCAASRHDPEEKYFLICANTKVPYWQTALAGLGKAANQLKVRTEMVGPDNYLPKAEHEEFQRTLAKKPTGILVSVSDVKLLQPDIDAAIAKGIPVITMDSDADQSKRPLFIGTDNHNAGVIGGKVLVKQLKGKGNVVIYTMPEQANLRERLRGYNDVFASSPLIKVVQIVDIKGDPRIAFDTTKELVSKLAKNIDAFVCLEAIACPEIADVLDREKVTGKVVVAMDTDARTLDWIRKDGITATIAQKPFTMAYFGVVMLDHLYHNKPRTLDKDWKQDSFSTLPTFVDTGATLIDKSNVDAFIKERDSATT